MSPRLKNWGTRPLCPPPNCAHAQYWLWPEVSGVNLYAVIERIKL